MCGSISLSQIHKGKGQSKKGMKNNKKTKQKIAVRMINQTYFFPMTRLIK
jgi:hypothetical protein